MVAPGTGREIALQQAEIVRIRLDGDDGRLRIAAEEIGRRVADVGAAIQDQAGTRDRIDEIARMRAAPERVARIAAGEPVRALGRHGLGKSPPRGVSGEPEGPRCLRHDTSSSDLIAARFPDHPVPSTHRP
jgi:hypothetical protein